MIKKIFIPILFMIVIAVFEFYPAIRNGRAIVPTHVQTNEICDCLCILASRPWYSTFNYWFWAFFISTPLFIFLYKPTTKKENLFIFFLCSLLGYFLLYLAVNLSWDIRNAPFIVKTDLNILEQKTWDTGCANISDSANKIFVLLGGWIPAMIYAGFWMLARYNTLPLLQRKMESRHHNSTPSAITKSHSINLPATLISLTRRINKR